MARVFVLPDLGEGLTEAEIVRVLVREGEVIGEDAPLVEVETDKAQVEIPSPMAGRVEAVHVRPGQTVKVGAPLVSFAAAGSGEARPVASAGPAAAGPATGERSATTAGGAAAKRAPDTGGARDRAASDGVSDVTARDGAPSREMAEGPVPATPATRRLARELGVDLRAVRATGPGGRVSPEDVRAAAAAGPTAAGSAAPGADEAAPAHGRPLAPVGLEPPTLPRFEQWGPVEREPLSHLRRTIAERMALSAAVIPHVTHFDRADITELDALILRNLERAKERGVVLTLTSFILKAAARALLEHPRFNASLDAAAGELVLKRYVHLAVAVATERGLIVPVIRDVDGKPLLEVARELGALAARVREGKATLEDLRGGTFTVTNLGGLGGTGAIPIINYPDVAILGVARARQEAVVVGGQIVPRLLLPLSLTFDHRVADGADGARFCTDIVRRLERPEQLLLDL
jgi:pyruvate dehydrogenase E2 component (dihydrolipoamide acetyltransferase)